MTHDEIDKMEAGRKLDALVAEKVMGLSGPFDVCDCGWPGNHIGKTLIPPYSTSISAAWEVVEKLKADGTTIDIQSRTPGWTVIVDELYDSGVEVRAPTAPVAICFAAIKAITGEPK